jgi:hypothetical protein
VSITNTSYTNTTSHKNHNKISLLLCGNVETNLGPIMNILQNHPQTHHDKHTTYFYKNTIQLKDVYQQLTLETKNNNKTENNNLIENIIFALIAIIAQTSTICYIKIKMVTKAKNITPNYTFYNKKTLIKSGDIESNPKPRFTLLLNHPQVHLERQKMYFYIKTTQIKPKSNHILELFKPYFNYTQTININQHLTQYCMNNNHCPKSYLFYSILITLAPTPTQSNHLIAENSTQWTTNLIKNLIECPNPLPTDLHKLQKFH